MDFDKLKAQGMEYLQKGKEVTLDLTAKGYTQVKIVNEQAKLQKAQRQLGALVYSLAKGKEENQPLVDKYIDTIASIEQEIEQLKAGAPVQSEEAAPEEVVVDVDATACEGGEEYVAVPMQDATEEENSVL